MAGGWLQRIGLALADATQDAWFFPRLAIAYYNRGVIYLAGGDFDKAVADFSETIRLHPRLFMAYQNRSVAYQGRGEHGLALADSQRALSVCRDRQSLHKYLPQIHVNRAISYKILGELERATAENETALRLNPRCASAYCERGVIHQAEDRLERAMDDFDIAVRLEPRNALFLRCRGYGYFYAGDFVRAATDLDRSLSQEVQAYAALMLHLARVRAGQSDAAVLRRHMQMLQTTDWPLPIADLLLRRQTTDAVMEQASTVTQRGEAAFFIGQMQLLAGKEEEAVRWFERALADCPPVFVEHTGARAELSRLGMRVH
jgi:lipoprotein NlpI